MIFDNRQLAVLVLLGALLTTALIANSGVRSSVKDLGKQLASPKLFTPFLVYGLWLAGLHWVLWRFGLWNFKLLGDSIFWVGITGLALLTLAATDAGKRDNFFRHAAVKAVKFAALWEAFLNVKTLSLLGELLVQLVLLLFGGLSAVASHDEKYRVIRTPINVLLLGVGLSLFGYTIWSVVQDWGQLDKAQEGRKFLLPIWLTLGAFPIAFAFSLVAHYGKTFALMKASTGQELTSLRSRIGVMLALRTRLLDINGFRVPYVQQAGRAKTIRGGMEAVRDFKAERRRKAAEERAQQARLEAFTGVEGTDMDGRQLDQREFEETKKALRWLSTCQMGWYNNGKRYRADILTIVGDFKWQGLPDDHGVVVKVRKDGKAWYAYRRTVTGWVLGIGSRTGTPDQWFYEGSEPPGSFPKSGSGWGESAYADTPSWE